MQDTDAVTPPAFSNVFVLCTGRCGSVTFDRACSHFTNYSSGHETLSREFGTRRLDYPRHHIEIDNRLSWFLGRLDKRFGKDAFYVHLYRDADKVAASYDRRWNSGIGLITAFNHGIMMQRGVSEQAAPELIETMLANIEHFLADKPHKISINIDAPEEGFREFARLIGAQGDIDAAVSAFAQHHNPTAPDILQNAQDGPVRVSAIASLEADRLKLKQGLQQQKQAMWQQTKKIAQLESRVKKARKSEKLAWIVALPILLLLSPILLPVLAAFWVKKKYFKAGGAQQSAAPAPKGPSDQSHATLEKPRTALQRAAALAQKGDYAEVVRYAEQNVEPSLAETVHILRANLALKQGDADGWLTHVNAYLEATLSDPIALTPGEGDIFDRLSGDCPPGSVDGPMVSVVMPAWNCQDTIGKAARSILDQTWKNLELIIVDDCSQDDTWGAMQRIAASDPRVKLLRNTVNMGPYVSKNLGLELATGAWITGQDSDDWSHPKRLETHLGLVLSAPTPPRASYTYMLRLQKSGWFGLLSDISNMSFDGVARVSSISTLYQARFLREKLGYWDSVRFGADSEMIARAKRLLGDEFQEFWTIGMLCLDEATSLTNHPETGVPNRASGADHPRKQYLKNFKAWHKAAQPEDLVLPLVPHDRAFAAPDRMRVPSEDIARHAAELAKPRGA